MSQPRYQFVRPLVAVAMVVGLLPLCDRPAAAVAVTGARHHRSESTATCLQ